jgi:hypothetical protein
VHLGRGKDKYSIRRGLLKALQQGVKRRNAQHVNFVDDINFVARAGRWEGPEGVDQIAHVIYAIVRSAIDLSNREAGSSGDLFTVYTL